VTFVADPTVSRRHEDFSASQPAVPRLSFEAKFERRDVWVGLYWDRKPDGLHFYVCPLPMLVLHGRVA